jgi:protoporphyrinogen oxidase
VVVIEREPHVGGLAASLEVAGVRVDHGSHRLHPTTPAPILAALRHLLGDDLQTRPRHGRVRLAGRWLAFPLQPLDLARHLPPALAARAAADAAIAPLRRRRPRADTFAEVVRAGLGPTITEAFYAPYVRKLWDADPTELAGELARRRVSAATSGSIARRLLGLDRNGRGQTFLYPRTGFGAIVERLADAAVDAGADLRTDTTVTTLTPTETAVTVETGDGRSFEAAHVFSTIPPATLASVTTPSPPEDVLAAARRLRHRALVLVYLVVARRRWTEFDAHYFPEPEVPASRVSEPKNYRDNPEDPTDRTVLCAEVPCWAGDDTWTASPADLGDHIAGALTVLGLPDPAPLEVEVRRLPHVYPVYRPGFDWDLSAVDLWLGAHPRVVTLGRQGMFVPDNTHHALAMAWDAAAALGPDGGFDHAAWAHARDRFRGHVVED